MKPTISIAIATYNESVHIEACLKSVAWADEIIIADGSSTDDTVKLAKNFKRVKIISTTNKPIFHINKNIAIDACTSEWILQLDADERVSPELKAEVLETISRSKSADGYWIPRSNYFLGQFLKKGGQYPDSTIRLYRRGHGRLPALDVHEQAAVKGTVGVLKNNLLHFADSSFSRYLLRHNRYTTLLAQQLKNQQQSINFFAFLNFYFLKPMYEFFLIYFRHRGYVDGFPGFVFAFFSALRFPIAFTKLYELNQTKTEISLQSDWD